MPNKDYITYHPYVPRNSYGVERRRNLTKEILENGTPLPQPLKYKDIDDSMKEFVENDLMVSFEGHKIPTMVLLSNQRFSEYAQSWQYVDENRNVLMNFKTIIREQNPGPGENQGGLWNIPGERWYTICNVPVLDKNGTESLMVYKMKQPYCVDLEYEVSIFTNQYDLVNEFNSKVNDKFKARQCYIRPRGHFIPLLLENVSDESEYSIDDRKYFSQSYHIKAMAYIINEEDISVSQVPMRKMIIMGGGSKKKKNKATVEIEDSGDYMNKEINVHITFPEYEERTSFVMDEDIRVNSYSLSNARYVKIHVNKSPVFPDNGFDLKEGDEVSLKIGKIDITKVSEVVFNGISKTEIISKDEVSPESMLDAKDTSEDIYVQ